MAPGEAATDVRGSPCGRLVDFALHGLLRGAPVPASQRG
jgi:hypothetical protein